MFLVVKIVLYWGLPMGMALDKSVSKYPFVEFGFRLCWEMSPKLEVLMCGDSNMFLSLKFAPVPQ
jgi:hypothetical protein